MNFFFENLSLLPETREVKEHFKLVFGSGKQRFGQDTAAQKSGPRHYLEVIALWELPSIQEIGVKAITDDAEEACGSCTSCDTLRIGNRENIN